MDEQLPFKKSREQLEGDKDRAFELLPLARKLLYHVRLIASTAEVPIFSATRRQPDGSTIHAATIAGMHNIRVVGAPSPAQAVERRKQESDREWKVYFVMSRWLSPAPREWIVFETDFKLRTAKPIYTGNAQPIAVVQGRVLTMLQVAPSVPLTWDLLPAVGGGAVPFTNSSGTFTATWTATGNSIIEVIRSYGRLVSYGDNQVFPATMWEARHSGYASGISWSAAHVTNVHGQERIRITPTGSFTPGKYVRTLVYAAGGSLGGVVGFATQPDLANPMTRDGALSGDYDVTFVISNPTIDHVTAPPSMPSYTPDPTTDFSVTARTVPTGVSGFFNVANGAATPTTLADLHAAMADVYLPVPIYLAGDTGGASPKGPGLFGTLGIPTADFAPALMTPRLAYDRSAWVAYSNWALQQYSEQYVVGRRYARGSSTAEFDMLAPVDAKWDATTSHTLLSGVCAGRSQFVTIKNFGGASPYQQSTLAVCRYGDETPLAIKWLSEVLPEAYAEQFTAGTLTLTVFLSTAGANLSASGLPASASTRVLDPVPLIVSRRRAVIE